MTDTSPNPTDIREANIEVEVTVRDAALLFTFGSYTNLLLEALLIFGIRSFNTIWTWLLLLSLVQIIVGLGMRDLKPWSRWPGIALCWMGFLPITLMWLHDATGLFLIPPIVWGLICVVTLTQLVGENARLIFSPPYRLTIAATPHVQKPISAVASGCGALGLALFVLGIWVALFSR